MNPEEEKIMSEKIDISKLKKSDQVANKRKELNEKDLEAVSGGFPEWGGYAAGYEVACPYCHRNKESDFVGYEEHPEVNVNFYKCVCGHVFGVDLNGNYWM